jgi:excinuclease ABC subunit C
MAKDNRTLQEKINNLPDSCGVYIFKDRENKIIYVGKAKSLKKRVKAYLGSGLSLKNESLVSKIKDIDFITTPSEKKAQLLENNLIKDKQPQYNISLKDDKSFPLIKITDEPFPIVSIKRKKKKNKDSAFYFGPYTNAKQLRTTLKLIRRIFGFRSCINMPKKPCLYYRINLCPAPCAKKISKDKYQKIISEIKLFLESKHQALLDLLSKRMALSSQQRNFEEAAKIRDQINALSSLLESKNFFIGALEELKQLLGLKVIPKRIEAFDISNIRGNDATGAMVSFYLGLPNKNNYRRFRIKTVKAIDDYRMLSEIIQRRYSRMTKEKINPPDLIIIDGGKGHLLTAKNELSKLRLVIPVISIAKEYENIYLADKNSPLKISEGSIALNLIRRIRDEAHRFAVSYHRLLRGKKIA